VVNVHIDTELPASIPNTSGATRYSIDFRTVHAADLRSGNGARIAHVECTGMALRDFHRRTDGVRFTEEEISPRQRGRGRRSVVRPAVTRHTR
jgi:hypothetical protein